MRRIIWRELLDKKWSLFWYCFASLALLWVYAATFKSSQASAQQLLAAVKAYPKALIDAFGLNSLAGNTIEQYLNGKHFSFIWPLMAILLALSRAGVQFAGEIQDGTMGLLLSMPVNRIAIFKAKYLAGLTTIVIFTAVSVFPVIPLASAYGISSHPHVLIATWVLTTLFMWSVYALGVLLSCFGGKVYPIGAAFLLLSYAANILALLDNKMSWLKHYSIFYYFDTASVLGTGHLKLSMVLVFGSLIIVSSAIAGWRFNQRDMYV